MKTNNEGRNLIELFKDEYEPAESRTTAEKAINALVRVRLTGNQFSAVVSLVMQIGLDAFKKSKMLKLLNKGFTVGAASEFDLHIYDIDDNGQRVISPFLIKHREFEKALFLKPELVQKGKR